LTENSGASSPSDFSHSDPEIRDGGPVSKKIFSALQDSFWSKNKGGHLPWICHWKRYPFGIPSFDKRYPSHITSLEL